MTILLILVHVAVCIFLILVVLLQTGKGADLAGAFGGGGSQTAFGARGATTLLHKLTTGSAVLFMATSLTLSILSSRPSGSVVEETGTPAAATSPAGDAPAAEAPVPQDAAPAAEPEQSDEPGAAAAEPDATQPDGGQDE